MPDGDVYILDNSVFAGEAIFDPAGKATIADNYLVAGAHNLAIWFSTFNGNYVSTSVPYLKNVTPLGVVPAPVLSLAAGTYSSGQSVTITDAASPDARIMYTTNGSAPSSLNGIIYSGPIVVAQSETISAAAFENGYTNSSVTSATYNIQAPTPTISPAGGTYASVLQVMITDSANSVPIYYTTDGTQPTTSSAQYQGPLNVSTSETVQAIASGNGYSSSNVASATYAINLPPADFSLTLSLSSLTVNRGRSATATLTIAPINGFDQPVSFACSGLPATVSCSFSPSAVAPAASTTTNLTITATSNTARGNSTRVPFAPVTSLTLGLGLLTSRRRRSRLYMVLIIAETGLFFLSERVRKRRRDGRAKYVAHELDHYHYGNVRIAFPFSDSDIDTELEYRITTD